MTTRTFEVVCDKLNEFLLKVTSFSQRKIRQCDVLKSELMHQESRIYDYCWELFVPLFFIPQTKSLFHHLLFLFPSHLPLIYQCVFVRS